MTCADGERATLNTDAAEQSRAAPVTQAWQVQRHRLRVATCTIPDLDSTEAIMLLTYHMHTHTQIRKSPAKSRHKRKHKETSKLAAFTDKEMVKLRNKKAGRKGTS